jgi:hypothetical protein
MYIIYFAPFIVVLTTSMNQSPSWEANSCHLASQEIPTFYGTHRFITVFTRAYHWSLSCTKCIQSTPSHPISLRSILILSFNLHLGFPIKILYAFLFHACYMSCTSHSCWYLIALMQVMQFSPASCHFHPLRSKYSLSTLFSYTLNLSSSLSVRDQVSHPYKT